LKTLHIDNVNALNFALYPEEAASITQAIVDLCTPGNVAAIGVESVDPVVIQKNNLKCTPDEILQAIEMINQYGAEVGTNGNPSFLPGLNFIMGLPGETAATLDANYQFLQDIYNLGLLIRRINLRKLLTPLTATQNQTIKEFTHDFEKDEKFYYHWKDQIREYIDFPMLKRVYPFGRILTNVFAEQHEGNGTYLRQVGTYPILCYAPKHLTLGKDYTLIIVDHGYRSLTCLEYPVDLIHLSLNELEHIPGIGKKRAVTIFTKQPNTESKWLGIVPKETLDSLKILQPNLY
jgi:radical SAM superfamily enzyme with C-terminal helix-hairpin-helix motif